MDYTCNKKENVQFNTLLITLFNLYYIKSTGLLSEEN